MKKIKKNITTTRQFNYEVDGSTLSFTLTLDDKKKVEAFKKCLLEALKDIESIWQ